MAGYYDFLVRHEAYRALRAVPRHVRIALLDFGERLATEPFREGDLELTDLSGRPLIVKRAGRFAAHFWVDHANREVRLVDVLGELDPRQN